MQVSAGASYTLPFSNLMVVEVAASYTSPVVVTEGYDFLGTIGELAERRAEKKALEQSEALL